MMQSSTYHYESNQMMWKVVLLYVCHGDLAIYIQLDFINKLVSQVSEKLVYWAQLLLEKSIFNVDLMKGKRYKSPWEEHGYRILE